MEFNAKTISFYNNLFHILLAYKKVNLITHVKSKTTLNGVEFKKLLEFLLENNLVEMQRFGKNLYYKDTEEGKYILSIYEEEKYKEMKGTLR